MSPPVVLLARGSDGAALRSPPHRRFVALPSRLSPWLFAIITSLASTLTSAQAPDPAQAAPVATPSEPPAPLSTPAVLPASPAEATAPALAKPVDLPPPPATNLKPTSPSGTATPKELSGIPIRAYGIFWASIFGTQPVQSFGLPTTVAPTAAINPAIYSHSDDALLSFQVQQTRMGMAVGEGTPFKGTLEIDFVHFNQSSPIAQAFPRIRIGLLEWTYKPNQKFFFGQTWDIYGNGSGPSLLSHSYNLVGTLFQSGNIGFMRQQLGWAGRFGALELSLAAGMQGANVGATFSNIELAAVPTGAARVMYHLPANHGVVGVSGIGTSLRFTNEEDDVRRRGAGGGHMFADLTFGPLNLHGELYTAQNLANTGSLNLGQGRYKSSVADAGGYLSGKVLLGKHAITAMYGYASVLRPSKVVPGYTPGEPPKVMGSAAVAAAVNTAFGPGIDHNMTAHIGYGYSPLKGLTIFLEPYVYATKFKLAPADVGKVASTSMSFGTQAGSMYVF